MCKPPKDSVGSVRTSTHPPFFINERNDELMQIMPVMHKETGTPVLAFAVRKAGMSAEFLMYNTEKQEWIWMPANDFEPVQKIQPVAQQSPLIVPQMIPPKGILPGRN
jgi:hypothetical protein